MEDLAPLAATGALSAKRNLRGVRGPDRPGPANLKVDETEAPQEDAPPAGQHAAAAAANGSGKDDNDAETSKTRPSSLRPVGGVCWGWEGEVVRGTDGGRKCDVIGSGWQSGAGRVQRRSGFRV